MIRNIVIVSVIVSSCSGTKSKHMNGDSTSHLSVGQTPNPMEKAAHSPDSAFNGYWLAFVNTIQNENTKVFIEMSLDSIEYNGKVISLSSFTKSNLLILFSPDLKSRLKDM